ncbi:FHA domain-containing protein [Catelliglobosispora koreensis]|uniref:FHA domain-containing protein n=1 Tax=Catelliglobosispora koreensis TaxID=129052 RepID=UPI00039F6040|nr:FHA domain-containing protein [Catelliglobosispora koreensis]
MLCHACHVHLRRDHPYCLHCGVPRKGAKIEAFSAPELRLGSKVLPLSKPVMTIGRSTTNDLVIDDPSVSRVHARVRQTSHGYVIEDLGSFNGTSVAGRVMHSDESLLNDETQLHIGDVPVVFAQPRSLAVGGKTVMATPELTALAPDGTPDVAPRAEGSLNSRPRRRSGWALKRTPDDRGVEQWVLRNTRTMRYLQLDDRDVFIWEQLDGENTVRDLLFSYAQKYGELALPRIEKTLRSFARLELIRGIFDPPETVRPPLLKRIGRTIFKYLLHFEVSVSGLDGLMGWMYRRFGWWFFTRTGVVLLWALIVAGIYGMVVAAGEQKLFDIKGMGLPGALIVGGAFFLALVVHEAAHALAVKSYGRTVTRGGFMLLLGLPLAFVDTSDMWFGSRWSRIVVTISGPLSTAGIGGACALIAAFSSDAKVSALAYHVAFGLYLNTVYNLNPLLPLDGYQALADALRMPRLREQATAYFKKGIWSDIRSGKRPGWRQAGMAIYGFSAIAGMGLFLVMAILMWKDRLGGLAEQYLPPGVDVLVMVLGLGLVLFPIWYKLAKRVMTFFQRRPKEAKTA